MLRPKMRPTLSRRTKYLGVAPTAQRKLGKEARRGSHDLRRLVGHANFLDVLIDQLDVNEDDEEEAVHAVNGTHAPDDDPHKEVEERDSDSDSANDSANDSWSDESDDDDHALLRSASHVELAKDISEAQAEIQARIMETGDDYFQRWQRTEADLSVEDAVSGAGLLQDEKDVLVVTAEAVDLTPPADEIVIKETNI